MPGVGMESSCRDILDDMLVETRTQTFGPSGPGTDVALPKMFLSRK